VPEREVVEMDQRLEAWDVSLDTPLKDDSRAQRIDFLSTPDASTEDQVAKKEMETLLHEKIAAFREKMTPRELEIFDCRIFADTPVVLQVIADRYGISKERVRQVEKNIFKKLKAFIKREIPDLESFKEIFSMN
jgi:RNA polymerase sigma-32 factor